MVWSREDFAREVRRQLVELETLRRKIKAHADLTDSIEKLEESQRYLLRKLEELSEAKLSGPVSPGESPAVVPPSIQAYLESIFQQPAVLQHLSQQIEDAGDNSGALIILNLSAGPPQRSREGPEGDFGQPYSLN